MYCLYIPIDIFIREYLDEDKFLILSIYINFECNYFLIINFVNLGFSDLKNNMPK